uniref:Uncharacterized protein n=1 Tax=Glossina austeni TaxID=7395 RepID=A0A1A9URD5_GLOAU
MTYLYIDTSGFQKKFENPNRKARSAQKKHNTLLPTNQQKPHNSQDTPNQATNAHNDVSTSNTVTVSSAAANSVLLLLATAKVIINASNDMSDEFTFDNTESLEQAAEQLWKLHEIESDKKEISPEEKLCESYFNQHVQINADDRFMVSVPFWENLTGWRMQPFIC